MQINQLAPVVLFVYNRPQHTKLTIESLKANELSKDSVLYIFADGPKPNASKEDKINIEQTRALIRATSGFRKVIILEKEINQGLAQSIISGVTEIIEQYGKLIVLEDDLLVSPHFLNFMNEGLELYESAANIYSINGFMFQLTHNRSKDVVLLPYTSTWGWATWKSKWSAFSSEMKDKVYLKSNPFLKNRFNLGDYHYTDMLEFGNNAWGIKWYYSVFIRNGLNVFPSQSLVKNIGFDGTGTNGGNSGEPEAQFKKSKPIVTFEEQLDLSFFDAFIRHFKKENISLLRRIINLFRKAR